MRYDVDQGIVVFDGFVQSTFEQGAELTQVINNGGK